MPELLRAILYTRVSTQEQALHNTSLDDQRERGLKYADVRGALPVRVFEDAGVSGSRYETRPGLMEALAYIEAGKADLLIVTKIDRLARSAKVVLSIAERIDRAGGQIVTCDGFEFGKTPIGRMLLTLLAAVAEFERDMIRERMMSGKQARASAGIQPSRSRSPYGYHIVTHKDKEQGLYLDLPPGTYVVLDDRAAIVREIFALYDAGTSLRKIAEQLQARGVETSKASKGWYASTVRSILENPAFKGLANFGNKEVVSGENLRQQRDPSKRLKCGKFYRKRASGGTSIPVPAIVDAALWERCKRKLESNTNDKQAQLGGRPGRKWMLTGLTRCPACGWRMGGGNRNSWGGAKIAYYTCNQNKACTGRYKSHRADLLERLMTDALRFLHEQPQTVADALRAYDAEQRAQMETDDKVQERQCLQEELQHVGTELANVKKAMLIALRAGLNEQDFQDELHSIARRRNALEARLQELAPQSAAITAPRESQADDTAAKLAEVAGAIVRVFTAADEDFTAGDKQALLLRVVESVTPTEDGAEIVWKETVQFAKMQPFVRVR